MKKSTSYFLVIFLFTPLFSCVKKEGCTDVKALNYDVDAETNDGSCIYSNTPTSSNNTSTTPYQLNIPSLFSQLIVNPIIPSDNPMTVEGVDLGRKLFFDPILSADGTQSCASCHSPANAFTDTNQFSTGIDGLLGTRNSMAIFNTAWNYNSKFFWDGRATGLEEQALGPVVNPIEMHNTWANATNTLQASTLYPSLFNQAFGSSIIDSTNVTKALAQFERTLISGNSRFDQYLNSQITLTADEIEGFNIFMDENRGDCFHCHGSAANPLWTDNDFHNNGLDATFSDHGLGDFTGNPNDNGKFKTPSLRNLAFTAPYMHDGRFATIDEVINHYSSGLVNSSTIDPLMKSVGQGGVQLNSSDKAKLKAFLLSLSDNDFITNPDFQNPNP